MLHPTTLKVSGPSGVLAAAVAAALSCAAASQDQFLARPHGSQYFYYQVEDLRAGDLDGDGNLDVLLFDPVATAILLLGDGSGGFRDATATHIPQGFVGSLGGELADLDNDGDLDVVATFRYPPLVRVFTNSGGGVLAGGPFGINAASLDHALSVGDVDGDGDVDVLMVGDSPGSSGLLINDGSGNFTPMPIGISVPPPLSTTNVVLGDIDGDGDLDLIQGLRRAFRFAYYYSYKGALNRLYLNDGGGNFTRAPMNSLSHNTQSLALGDVDSDGDLDLLTGNAADYCYGGPPVDHRNELYLNDGLGQFVNATATHMPAVPSTMFQRAQLVDLDDDGALDILVSTHGADLLINDGSGVFTAQSHRIAGYTGPLFAGPLAAIGDADGDGDIDLFAYDSVAINLRRHTRATTPARIGQPFTVQFDTQYGPPTVVIPFVSGAAASLPIQGLGTLGIDPAQAVSLPWQFTSAITGSAFASISLPSDPALVGLGLFGQSLFVEGASGQLSNVTSSVIGQ